MPPIKVAFWNINTGQGSFPDRPQTLKDWCSAMNPDLLILEEVSDTLANDLPALTGLTPLNYVNTLDKNGKESTKQIWALEAAGMAFKATVLRLTGAAKAKRATLKLTRGRGLNAMTIRGLHANATPWGGLEAVKAAVEIVDDDPTAVVGGDFNCSLQKAQTLITHGITAVGSNSWQHNALQVTQWSKHTGQKMAFPNATLHLQTSDCGTYTIEPNPRIIDYAIAGSGRNVAAADNCIGQGTWIDILVNFDHAPVVFDIT